MDRRQTWARVMLSDCNLSQVPHGPSMLDVFQAGSWNEGFEARFIAAQNSDARESFEKDNMLRREKQVAVLEKSIKGKINMKK